MSRPVLVLYVQRRSGVEPLANSLETGRFMACAFHLASPNTLYLRMAIAEAIIPFLPLGCTITGEGGWALESWTRPRRTFF